MLKNYLFNGSILVRNNYGNKMVRERHNQHPPYCTCVDCQRKQYDKYYPKSKPKLKTRLKQKLKLEKTNNNIQEDDDLDERISHFKNQEKERISKARNKHKKKGLLQRIISLFK